MRNLEQINILKYHKKFLKSLVTLGGICKKNPHKLPSIHWAKMAFNRESFNKYIGAVKVQLFFMGNNKASF
jgi:hypothetical protein